MRFLTAVALAAVMLWVPVDGVAQDLRPIDEILDSAEGDPAVLAYGTRRCAALWANYQLLWMEDRPELSETFNQQKALLIVAAHRFAQAKQEREVPLATTAQEINDIAQIYRERADRNRALTGDYFAGDPLVERDGATCRAMVQMLADRL